MASSSHKVIYAALTANVLIAIAKFVTAAITGSSSMLAEGISSDPAVDAVGQVLTMQLGPESVLVNIDVRFKPQGSLDSLENTIAESKTASGRSTQQSNTFFWKPRPCKFSRAEGILRRVEPHLRSYRRSFFGRLSAFAGILPPFTE